ncbi:histidine phosphatase family protein [Ornithinibacillus halotolerans]|uniref:Phosphatase PhoE n=1 Tax=Ornithinibacillus halotolerans TaxID=1274357 RepID=A0A916RUB3_9BACI|nr:histidine phosphatase family protein [Ornithinibacillus halotolerans]GGA70079.1 putative phosphatase PhoE [Ornithinibacillus halotolerans]
MTTIYLVRHGQTDWNVERRAQGQTDIPLNDTGIGQADACGRAMDSTNYDLMITSHLKRARKTAEIINSYLDLPLVVMEDFAERSFGNAEGLTIAERDELYPDRNYPNQEKLDVFSTRILKGLEQVHQNYQGKRILLVTHGAVIYRVLQLINKGKTEFRGQKIKNTSITTITRQEEEWLIQDFNQINHLQEAQTEA